MTGGRAAVWRLVKRVAGLLPRRVVRAILDFPGVLALAERVSQAETVEVRSPEGARILMNPLFHLDFVAARSLADYEPAIRRAIATLAAPGMTAYDIGANVGVFSFLLASRVGPRGAVFAFEPEPNNYRQLERSVRLNRAPNIILDRRAIGRTRGTARFDRRGGAFSGRLIGERPGYTPTDNVITVETVSVDELVQDEGLPPPDLVKIDVEGNEGLVLEGMVRTLEAHGPVIICEVHTHLGDAVERVRDLLVGHGYAIYSSALEPVDEIATARHIIARRERRSP
ncbi:MAG: FkbM family methyltransferase [Gemmatimonadetes bacterium]|nr:FkbM family methyltransferase [Gemmatimonadota bacterium]